MPSRRQEKFSRVIKEAVSDIINNHMNDPRIEGFISVTGVDLSPDLKTAHVSLSVMTQSDSAKRKTLTGIQHAAGHIQHLLGDRLTSKFCPHLTFEEDSRLKGTLETLKLIEEANKELQTEHHQEGDQSQ